MVLPRGVLSASLGFNKVPHPMTIDLDKISEADLAAAYRAKGARCFAIADMLEGKTPALQTAPEVKSSTQDAVVPPAPSGRSVAVEEVRGALLSQSYRMPRLAALLNTSEEVIKAIVANPDNGIEVGERGWLKLVRVRQRARFHSLGGLAGMVGELEEQDPEPELPDGM